MPTVSTRLLRWLDPFFAVSLAAALAMVVLTAWAPAAWAADTATDARTVGEFTAVQTLGPDVRVRQGTATTVSVQAEPKLLAQIETVVEDTRLGRTLVVRWKRGANGIHLWVGRQAPEVLVVAPRITGLQVRGSGDLTAEGLTPPSLSVQVDGSGDVRLTGLATESLSLAITGSGDISASGRAARLQASIAGSGDITADRLVADAVDVSIAGSGDVKVQAEKTLSVRIAGSGDVVYGGNPVLTQSIAGSGGVVRR